MNRRTVLQSASVAGVLSLAGCLEVIEDHFGAGELATPVSVEIFNESGETLNIALRAIETESGRESYDHSYTVGIDEDVRAPHLGGTDQRLNVILFGDLSTESPEIADSEDVEITTNTQMVQIVLHTDELEVTVRERETGDEADNRSLEESDVDEPDDHIES